LHIYSTGEPMRFIKAWISYIYIILRRIM
jgi:hypothetical protein